MWNIIKLAAANFANMQNTPSASPTPANSPAAGISGAAENATVALGRQLRTLGQSLGQSSAPMGMQSAAAFTAARGLESAGKYLEDEGFGGVVHDAAEGVKRNPIPAIVAGIGLGLLLGRLLPRRR